MEKDKNLVKYLLFGGALGLSYFIIQYLSARRKSTARPASLEKTAKVMQEIKYQVLTTCFNYAEAVSLKLKGTSAEKDLEIVFRTELTKIYEARENAVLNKHDLAKDVYGASLQQYKKEDKIKKGLSEIFDMMERAVRGVTPDLTVLPQAQQHLTKEQLLATYFEMCQLIAVRLWQKLEDSRRNNPGFNSRDETHYQKAIKDLSIFDIKTDFLKSKGYRVQWGSPNEIFYKIMESSKQNDPSFKTKAVKVEKAYEKTIEAITTQSGALTAERIRFMLQEAADSKAEQIKPAQPQPQSAQARPFVAAPISKSLNKQTKPKKNEDDDLENLMMQELLNRSAQNSKEPEVEKQQIKFEQRQFANTSNENKVQATDVVDGKKEEEPVPEAVAEPVPEAVAEPVPEAVAEPVPEAVAEPVPEAVAEPVPEVVKNEEPQHKEEVTEGKEEEIAQQVGQKIEIPQQQIPVTMGEGEEYKEEEVLKEEKEEDIPQANELQVTAEVSEPVVEVKEDQQGLVEAEVNENKE